MERLLESMFPIESFICVRLALNTDIFLKLATVLIEGGSISRPKKQESHA